MAFGLLDSLRALVLRAGRFASCLVAPHKEVIRIPCILHAPTYIAFSQQSGGLFMQGGEDGMLARLPEPIARVSGIGFGAMNDSVPIAAFARWDILRDLVAKVPVTGEKEKTTEGGFGIARVWEEFGGICGEKIGREFLGLKFAGRERDGVICRFPEHNLFSR